MASLKLTLIVLACLVAVSTSAPASSDTPTAEFLATSASTSASAPTPGQHQKDINNNTPSTSVTDVERHFSMNTTFTCFSRPIGYYADLDQNCKVYHFCLPGEYNGEQVFQRISYLCLGDTFFDQQQLDCVEHSTMKAPCKESESHFLISNNVLRQTILGQKRDATTSTNATAAV